MIIILSDGLQPDGEFISDEWFASPAKVEQFLENADEYQAQFMLAQSAELQVSPEIQQAIFACITDTEVLDEQGYSYLEGLIDIYCDSYTQRQVDFPSDIIERRNELAKIIAAIEFGFPIRSNTLKLAMPHVRRLLQAYLLLKSSIEE
jgi:hypothetical protein